MKQNVRLLPFTARASVALLTFAGILIVVSIFNEYVDWDIFGPNLEAILYGVFGSCIALASVGVAMTFVLGVQEITRVFQAIQHQKAAIKSAQIPEATRGRYILCLFSLILFFTILIVSLTGINKGVQKHRSGVFKRLVATQMEQFQPKLCQLIEPFSTPPRQKVSFDLYDLTKTLNNLSYINKITLYLPDPKDSSTIWTYNACRGEYRKKDGFTRYFVAKDYEKAIAKGMAGNGIELMKLNEKTGFIWYHLLRNKKGKAIGVLRINGNSRDNFREYMLGS